MFSLRLQFCLPTPFLFCGYIGSFPCYCYMASGKKDSEKLWKMIVSKNSLILHLAMCNSSYISTWQNTQNFTGTNSSVMVWCIHFKLHFVRLKKQRTMQAVSTTKINKKTLFEQVLMEGLIVISKMLKICALCLLSFKLEHLVDQSNQCWDKFWRFTDSDTQACSFKCFACVELLNKQGCTSSTIFNYCSKPYAQLSGVMNILTEI